MTNTICDGNGDQLTTGLQDHQARKVAQEFANERGESVFLTDSDGEEWEIEPKSMILPSRERQIRHVCEECGNCVSVGEMVNGGWDGGFCEAHPKATVASIFVSEETLVASDAETEHRERSAE